MSKQRSHEFTRAEPVNPPTKVMHGVCTALVRAPGGVLIGFSGPTE